MDSRVLIVIWPFSCILYCGRYSVLLIVIITCPVMFVWIHNMCYNITILYETQTHSRRSQYCKNCIYMTYSILCLANMHHDPLYMYCFGIMCTCIKHSLIFCWHWLLWRGMFHFKECCYILRNLLFSLACATGVHLPYVWILYIPIMCTCMWHHWL